MAVHRLGCLVSQPCPEGGLATSVRKHHQKLRAPVAVSGRSAAKAAPGALVGMTTPGVLDSGRRRAEPLGAPEPQGSGSIVPGMRPRHSQSQGGEGPKTLVIREERDVDLRLGGI